MRNDDELDVTPIRSEREAAAMLPPELRRAWDLAATGLKHKALAVALGVSVAKAERLAERAEDAVRNLEYNTPKPRRCLICDKTFNSLGAHNRTCDPCKHGCCRRKTEDPGELYRGKRGSIGGAHMNGQPLQ